MSRTFNGMKHLDNFCDYILRTKGWHLDECYVNSGYPFDLGDTYYMVERGEVIEFRWDAASEKANDLNPNQMYFYSKRGATEYAQRNVNNF